METLPLKKTIVLVEDDLDLNNLLSYIFKNEGYQVFSLTEGKNALETILEISPDFVLLDWNLPEKSGDVICQELRNNGVKKPIFFLTSNLKDKYKINAFHYGASGYLEKPINPKVLLAVVENKLQEKDFPIRERINKFNDFIHYPETNVLIKSGKRDQLSNIENKVLDYLFINKNQIVSRDQLALHIWGRKIDKNSNLLDMHLLRLRRKIEKIPKLPSTILSIRGKGIIFKPITS